MSKSIDEPGQLSNLDKIQKDIGIWNRAVVFLKRDVKSFLPNGKKNQIPIEQSMVEGGLAASIALVEPPIESLVDLNNLSDLVFKREVLDWRDGFHANVGSILYKMHETFVQYINAELDNIGLFRKLISRSTSEVLQDSFVRIVRLPLIALVREEEAKLNSCAQKWGVFGKTDLTFDIRKLNSECASLQNISFKPRNKGLILAGSQVLILGHAGIAAYFCDQGLLVARRLMESKRS
jgi:hypothetical protein